MKFLTKILLSVLALILYSTPALAEGAKSPEELASKVKQAIVDKDSKTISALYYWEGVDPGIEKQLKESIVMMLEEPPRKADVIPVPDNFQAVQEMGSQRFSQNLKVEGMIRLVYSLEDESAIATMPYGAKEGSYYLTAPIIIE